MYKMIERNGGKEEREGTTGCTQVESERRERGGCKKREMEIKKGEGYCGMYKRRKR